MKMRIAVPSSFLADHLADSDTAPVIWNIDDSGPVPDIEMLVTGKPDHDLNRARVSEIPSLRLIQLMSLGYDWIEGFRPDGVPVATARGVLEPFAAEHAIGLLIAGFRRLDIDQENRRRRLWIPRTTTSIRNTTVILLGYGGLGKTIEHMLSPFHPGHIIRVARTARRLQDGTAVHSVRELPSLAARADALICTLPGTPSTSKVVNDAVFNALHDGAVIVNVGRGTTLDTLALQTHLESQRLVAMLDVVDPEPLGTDSPLWTLPNVVVTPHVGGEVTQAEHELLGLIQQQVSALHTGADLQNLV
ncbi:hypothetical protein F8O07_02030 [Pseudoclavibacter sp. CFCC 13796]|uniref:NAD(P)-dependent oxidoreductase n=1 Tax=Pseudoclavibacter sp. CFCC 13796 TaxID=2615179 RepID=UPI001300D734|nr:NAD(P)-dependent oxidoreductase [Pseudoclavibacter sp. CFCC 13796]KAB1660784.1 hypothetical protein F8O07_02030 [Pseudoclavibacter sp. CFCC 13796]